MRNTEVGSIWRQWDLHVHTPSSFDYKDKSVTDHDIVRALIDDGVEVACITDHHVIDCGRIEALRAVAGDRLAVLPGIELRSELGGGDSVHFVGIFAEDSDVDYVWTNLQGPLKISPVDVRRKGDEKVYADFRQASQLIRELGGLVSVHAGRKSNSLEGISNADQFKQALKEDLSRDFIDLLEVQGERDAQGYLTRVFPELGFSLPTVACSDCHDARRYSRRTRCWIRANPTLAGLRQATIEPEDRVFRGERPPLLERVERNPTKYVSSVRVHKRDGSSLCEEWFDCSLDLNPGLVAIIGRKGSGKSALAEVLGLCGATPNAEHFSFLHEQKFRHPKTGKAGQFVARVTWASGDTTEVGLDDKTDVSALQMVTCIPQHYLETICNEIAQGTDSRFDREIESVVFSHVSEADRLKKTSLQGLIAHHTSEIHTAVAQDKAKLHEVNLRIVEIERQLSAEHRQQLDGLLDMKVRELAAHDAAKPMEVHSPERTDGQEETEAERKMRTKLAEAEALDVRIGQLEQEQARFAERVSSAEKLLAGLANLEQHVAGLRDGYSPQLQMLELAFEDVVQFRLHREVVQAIRDGDRVKAEGIDGDLDPTNDKGSRWARSRLREETTALQGELEAPQREYAAYQATLAEWNEQRRQIVGDETTPGSKAYVQHRINEIADLPARLATEREGRLALTRSIYKRKELLAQTYRRLYGPVQEFIEARANAREPSQIGFHVAMEQRGFADRFLEFINQGKRGSFYGAVEGGQVASGIVSRASFDAVEGTLEFIEEVLAHLTQDRRSQQRSDVALHDQLNRGKDVVSLYDYLFSLDFLEPRYVLRWQGRELQELSPGERGTVLLIFYLLVDKSDVPLIIDQPEENLDNETIYRVLVPCVKEARGRRQVIMVTHNPNLAVVCDADQVVHASIDRQGGIRVTYAGGAIEDPETNRRIVDVLEGTHPAFRNRERKYQTSPPS